MNTLKKVILIIFWCIWGGALIFFHLGIAAARSLKDKSMLIISIVFIVLWWIITISGVSIYIKISDKIDAKRKLEIQQSKEEYRRKYITEFKIQNETLGELILEKDSQTNTVSKRLDDTELKIPFGKFRPYVEFFEIPIYDIDLTIKDLSEVYQNAEKYISSFFEEVCLYCENYDETDAENNPVDIEYVRKYTDIFAIEVFSQDSNTYVKLVGSVLSDKNNGYNLLGEHWVYVIINCQTNELDYGLEG